MTLRSDPPTSMESTTCVTVILARCAIEDAMHVLRAVAGFRKVRELSMCNPSIPAGLQGIQFPCRQRWGERRRWGTEMKHAKQRYQGPLWTFETCRHLIALIGQWIPGERPE